MDNKEKKIFIDGIVEKVVVNQNISLDDIVGNSQEREDWYDMALVKVLPGSCVREKGQVKSHQSSILSSIKELAIFPVIKRNEVDGKVIGRFLTTKLPISVMSNNLKYLQEVSFDNNSVLEGYCTTNEASSDRMELGTLAIDSKVFTDFYQSLYKECVLVVLKLRNEFKYVFLGIRPEDYKEYFGEVSLKNSISYADNEKRITGPNMVTFLGEGNVVKEETAGYTTLIGFNKIYSGAPGTGKSNKVNKEYFNEYSKRVTFHPEYEYQDFVGYIRPVKKDKGVSYDFVPGVFTRILVSALKNNSIMHNLIIEEMNRANTASVFGDLFQLLDRDENGSSEYVIDNKDIYDYIKKEIGVDYDYPEGVVFIPNNLSIIATVNTADQNVYAMDTAFIRRWDREYIDIKFEENHTFKDNLIQGLGISWKNFVENTNSFMMALEQSDLMIAEDKQIGPYFIKSGELNDNKKFAYKVLYYLWDDVFKIDRERVFCEEVRTFSTVVKNYVNNDISKVFNKTFLNCIRYEVENNPINNEGEQQV